MDIGKIVSTVQSEPLEDLLGEEVLRENTVLTEDKDSHWPFLENDEITPEVREDIFA